MFATWETSGTSGSNGARIAEMPLIASAPIVVPWYATRRAIALYRLGAGARPATIASCIVSASCAPARAPGVTMPPTAFWPRAR